MSFWSSLLRYGGTAARSLGKATGQAGKSAGHAVLHPSQTLRGAGQAMKSAAVGGAVGYVAWEKLTTDKSVARIVSDAMIGESATDTVVESVGDMKEKAGEAMDSVSATADRWNDIGNFFQGIFSGNALDMFGNFFGNLAKGNVSGLSLAGLLLGLMLIGNNSNVRGQDGTSRAGAAQSREDGQEESQEQSTGMRR